jgi:hypothetical protein
LRSGCPVVKKLLILLVLAGLGYVAYTRFMPSGSGTDGYSLKQPDQPKPKAVFFALWGEVAEGQCDNAQVVNNLTPDACRALVRERGPACALDAGRDAPAEIQGLELSTSLGHKYLQCVTPYYFCNGVELKTDAEIERGCK